MIISCFNVSWYDNQYFKERGRKHKQSGQTFAQYLFTFGTSYDICCVYVSSFSNRANTTWENGEMVAHCLLSYFEEREHV